VEENVYQVSFLIKSRADGRRGILLRSIITSRGATWATSLARRFAPTPPIPSSSAPRRTEAYAGGSDAERVGGRRKKCFSLRAEEEGTGGADVMILAGAGIKRRSSTRSSPPPISWCALLARNGGLTAIAGAAACAPRGIIGPPYPGSGGGGGVALGSPGDLHSDDEGSVRAPNNTGAAADLAFRTGNADFIGTRDLDAAAGRTGVSCCSCTSALALASVGWRVVVVAAARRLAMPLRGDRVGSLLSLSAAKKARCREVRAFVLSGAGGLLWKPSAGCKTGEVELPDKNSGANFL
jgi:hypothetical protein